MNPKDIALVKALQDGLKLERRPFLRLAKELGEEEEEIIARLKSFLENGIIRRIGISLRPEKTGYSTNALVAWQVDQSRVEEVGNFLAKIPEISHCYERECPEGWEYNMFTMIHSTSKEHLEDILYNIQKKCNLDKFRIFPTKREFKKVTMKYFFEEGNK